LVLLAKDLLVALELMVYPHSHPVVEVEALVVLVARLAE